MSHQPHNIHAGTQIVTKVGVHGSNNALVHPRDAKPVLRIAAKQEWHVLGKPFDYSQHHRLELNTAA